MAEQLVTVSKIREVVSGADMRTDSNLPDAFNACLHELLNGAIDRTRENDRATVQPADLAGQAAQNPASLTVASRLKEAIKAAGLRSSGELPGAVDGHAHAILEEAITRARANGRSTVRPHDLPTIR